MRQKHGCRPVYADGKGAYVDREHARRFTLTEATAEHLRCLAELGGEPALEWQDLAIVQAVTLTERLDQELARVEARRAAGVGR